MPGPATVITVFGLRLPAFIVGVSISVAAHVGLMATLAAIPSGGGWLSAPQMTLQSPIPPTPPTIEFSFGEPIQVRIVEDSTIDSIQDDAPRPSESLESIEFELTTEIDVVEAAEAHDIEAESSRNSAIDWSALVTLLRSMERSHSAPAAPITTSSPTKPSSSEILEDEDIASPVEPARASRDTAKEPASVPDQKVTQRGIDRGAAIIELPQPIYPRRSIRLEQEGTAVIEITIRPDGTLGTLRFRTRSGHSLLDKAAVEAVRKGRFSPALENGRPVEAIIVVPFDFHLTTE